MVKPPEDQHAGRRVIGGVERGTPTKSIRKMGEALLLTVGAFLLTFEFFAYSPLRCLLDTLSHCKQRNSIVSKKVPVVSKKAQNVNKKLPNTIVSKKAQL